MSSDVQHEAIQGHIASCGQCQYGATHGAKGFGQASQMCPKYLQIIEWFSQGREL
jgi:hypothetical protein